MFGKRLIQINCLNFFLVAGTYKKKGIESLGMGKFIKSNNNLFIGF